MPRISKAGIRNVAKGLVGKKPRALKGNVSKAERTLYKHLIAMSKKNRKKTAGQLTRKKPTGLTRRKTKKLEVGKEILPRKIPSAELMKNLEDIAITEIMRASWHRVSSATELIKRYPNRIEKRIRKKLRQMGFEPASIYDAIKELGYPEKRKSRVKKN